jgi:phosphotriesterase-related protein
LGRDVKLLQKLSQLSGLQIITNTGYYGAVDNKFFPGSAQALNADEIAQIWINEFEEGIDGSKIKPGFIKISVNPGPVSPLHQKLVQAAAIAHLHTGLTIASHTGLALPAFEEIKILKQAGVNPSAFIWVHAQSEPDKGMYLKAAKEGAWISLDGLSDETVGEYLTMLIALKKEGYLSKVLISHDAGYYDPNKEEGGSIRRYTTLFDKLLPALGQEGFTKDDITQLLVKNPAEAFTLRIRKL